MMRRSLLVGLAFLSSFTCSAQVRTVGVVIQDSTSFQGYTLFAPLTSTRTFLIDNCGKLINEWTSEHRPGFAAYLLETGDLLRTLKLDKSMIHGGAGGGVERISWDGVVHWSFELSDSNINTHHDVRVLPNGNVLMLAAVRIPRVEVIRAGRDSMRLFADMWIDKIIEVKPIGTDSGEIVWEWFAFDHTVQERDEALPNYGVVSQHPGRIDLNYYSDVTNVQYRDFTHLNGVDYDVVNDRILVSVRSFDEVWIIDHSTTTAEAKGTTGGRSGKGGEILYRWGNPDAYNRGVKADRTLYSQHSAHWIREHRADSGKIIVFNNGTNRAGSLHSSVELFKAATDDNGSYILEDGKPYGPIAAEWTYKADPPNSFFSTVYGHVQRLENGHTLITHGTKGTIFEVDDAGVVHWRYVNPITTNGPLTQGDSASANTIFSAVRYSPSYKAFEHRDMQPGARLEQNPMDDSCIISNPTSVHNEENSFTRNINATLQVSPNPFTSELHVISLRQPTAYRLIDVMGAIWFQGSLLGRESLNTSNLPNGMYFLTDETGAGIKLVKLP